MAFAGAVRDGLVAAGVHVTLAGGYADGLRLATLNEYDACLLDIMLPDGSGVELCRRLRAEGRHTPVLFLTARDAVEDRVRGLDVGGDDYLTKPFALSELLARLRAVTRRSSALLPERVVIADLEVDLRSRALTRAGRVIELTNKEWDLLEYLVRHQGAVVDRGEITAYVWDDNHDPASNALEVLVRRLRAKIDDGFEPRLIHTLRGAGYRFGP